MTKPKLPYKNQFTIKDQMKSDKANKFIGRGSPNSSTNSYREVWGALANTGQYNEQDVVFISAEGLRTGRLSPDFEEIQRALQAKATILTDPPYHRCRSYNIGERQVAEFLLSHDYDELTPGRWGPLHY